MGIKAKMATAVIAHTALWLAMLVALAGILFCAWGIYQLLAATALGGGVAALIVGVLLIGLVVLVARIAVARQNPSRQAAVETDKPREPADNMLEQQLRPVLGNRATDWTRQNTGVAVAGAVTIGLVLAASPRLRSFLVGAVGPLATRKAMQAAQRFMD